MAKFGCDVWWANWRAARNNQQFDRLPDPTMFVVYRHTPLRYHHTHHLRRRLRLGALPPSLLSSSLLLPDGVVHSLSIRSACTGSRTMNFSRHNRRFACRTFLAASACSAFATSRPDRRAPVATDGFNAVVFLGARNTFRRPFTLDFGFGVREEDLDLAFAFGLPQSAERVGRVG